MIFNKDELIAGFRTFYPNTLKIKLSNSTVANLLKVIGFIEADDWESIEQVSYFLATIGHETGWVYAPRPEKRATSGPIRQVQDNYWRTGFYGRGYIQLTWKRNYQAFTKILGIDLVSKPDKLITEPALSYRVAEYGMRHGTFTDGRHKLANYINDNKKDYVGARKIVNGTDKAKEIAAYATKIESILRIAVEEESEFDMKAADIKNFVFDAEQVHEESIPVQSEPTVFEQPVAVVAENPVAVVVDNSKTVTIEPTEPVPTSGIKNWKATLLTILGGGTVSGGGIWSWFNGNISSALVIAMLITFMVCGTAAAIFYISVRSKEKMQRAKEAHEVTMRELEIRSNPQLINTEVRK